MTLRTVGQQRGGSVPHLEEIGGLAGELLGVAKYEPGLAGQYLHPVRVGDQDLRIVQHDQESGGYGRFRGPVAPPDAIAPG